MLQENTNPKNEITDFLHQLCVARGQYPVRMMHEKAMERLAVIREVPKVEFEAGAPQSRWLRAIPEYMPLVGMAAGT